MSSIALPDSKLQGQLKELSLKVQELQSLVTNKDQQLTQASLNISQLNKAVKKETDHSNEL
jgi:hypothetical protein